MRMREVTAGVLLMLAASIQGRATICPATELANESCPSPEEARRTFVPERKPPLLIPEPSALIKEDGPLSVAYHDAMKILQSKNQCSSFFGGSEASVDVFGNFMASLRKEYLPSSIGLKMSGDYTNVINAATQVRYRLFDKATLNTGGPFYKQKISSSTATIPPIGSFVPNSREARVLMLLHELGHLMRGRDGKWLLPDDGRSMAESLTNTRTIESVCGEEIRALAKTSPTEVVENNSEQPVSPAAATSSHR